MVKGQGHQAALLAAAFTHQAGAVVSVGTYSPLTSAGAAVGSAARGASAPTEGGEGRGHIVAAARPPTACYYYYYQLPGEHEASIRASRWPSRVSRERAERTSRPSE